MSNRGRGFGFALCCRSRASHRSTAPAHLAPLVLPSPPDADVFDSMQRFTRTAAALVASLSLLSATGARAAQSPLPALLPTMRELPASSAPAIFLDRFRPLYSPASLSASTGQASWYGPGFYGNRTANGEVFRPGTMTAAHPSLPFGTRVRVTNRQNGRSAVVRINDRGPFHGGRVIDLSEEAAHRLGAVSAGVVDVRLQVLR